MDVVSKHRLVGAAIWLGFLVIIVPIWYSQPVNFVPDGEVKIEAKSTLPLVDHAYRLPVPHEKPLTNGQSEQKVKQSTVVNDTDAVQDKKVIEQAVKQTIQQPEKEPVITSVKPVAIDKQSTSVTDVVSTSDKYQGQWVVRFPAYHNVREANELLGRLEVSYDVYIKFFEKSKMYSVRIGPYLSKAKAEKDKQKLDKMLRNNGEVVQLP